MQSINVASNLQTVRDRIVRAEECAGREFDSVHLLAVSKTKDIEMIRAAYEAGQRAFGENYAQEAIEKSEALTDLNIEWHFIGPIQSNKTRGLASHMHWVHTVDREKIARRLSEQRPDHLAPLNVCVQVNVSGEASKAGVMPEQAEALAETILQLPRLRLRGLMAIPAPSSIEAEQREPMRQLTELLASLQKKYAELDTLSMGMSADLEAAVKEGATIVRVGTDIFGTR